MRSAICSETVCGDRYHSNKPKSGRKRVTTRRMDRKIVLESLQTSNLVAALSEETGTIISVRTTRRKLAEPGLRSCKALKRSGLPEVTKMKRLQWALKHQHFTGKDWLNIIWSDESNFEESFIYRFNNPITMLLLWSS